MSRYTGPAGSVLADVKGRNGGLCLRGCGRQGEQCHHRTPRGMGGTRDAAINQPPNLVWICQPCHTYIESHRTEAYRDGWLVRRGADATQQYLITLDHKMIMLGHQGGMVTNSLAGINEGTPF